METLKSGGGSLLNNQEKLKKIIKIIIIILLVFVVGIIALIFSLYNMDKQTLKVLINGEKMAEIPDDLFVFEESGEVYINIKSFSTIVGYKTKNGGYKDYTESLDECYAENDDEVAEFKLDSNRITKYNKISNIYECFDIEKPITKINDALYITIEGISVADNVKIAYDSEANKIEIVTLNAFAEGYIAAFDELQYKSVLRKTEGEEGEEELKNSSNYNNLKAILYGLMVVKDEDGNIGVCDLTGKEIIGTKYKTIEFI